MVSTESHVSSLLTWLVLWRCEGRLGRAGLAVGAPPVSLAVGLARGWAAITWTTGSKQRQFLFPTFSFSPAPSLPFLNNSVLSAEPGRRVRRHQGAVGPSRWPASWPGLGGGMPSTKRVVPLGRWALLCTPWTRGGVNRCRARPLGRACRFVPCAQVPGVFAPSSPGFLPSTV